MGGTDIRRILVCTRKRAKGHPRGCCEEQGGRDIYDQVRASVKTLGLSEEVRVLPSGCLGMCGDGSCLVIGPDGVQSTRVDLKDVPAYLDCCKSRCESVARAKTSVPVAGVVADAPLGSPSMRRWGA